MNRVIILGAGASFGNGAGLTKPPLAHEFFMCDSAESLRDDYSVLLRYLDDYSRCKISSRSAVDIEELYGLIEGFWALCKFDWKWRLEKFGDEFALISPPQMLRSYIIDIIFESTMWLQQQTCPYHDMLCRQIVSVGDTVINFNYDLIMDTTIKKHFQWNEYNGYGFLEPNLIKNGTAVEKSEVTVLKPHGSMNWFHTYSSLPNFSAGKDVVQQEKVEQIQVLSVTDALKGYSPNLTTEKSFLRSGINCSELYNQVLPENTTERSERNLKMSLLAGVNKDSFEMAKGYIPLLVMPNRYKSFQEMSLGQFKIVWQKTYEALEQAEEIIVIGYSLRDLHFNQLLHETTRLKNKPTPVTVVVKSEQDIIEIQQRTDWLNIEIKPVLGGLANYVATLS